MHRIGFMVFTILLGLLAISCQSTITNIIYTEVPRGALHTDAIPQKLVRGEPLKVSTNNFKDEVLTALDKWNKALRNAGTNFDIFVYEEDASKADISILGKTGQTIYQVCGPGTIACIGNYYNGQFAYWVVGEPHFDILLPMEMIYDTAYFYSVSFYIRQSIFAHELGHALGLADQYPPGQLWGCRSDIVSLMEDNTRCPVGGPQEFDIQNIVKAYNPIFYSPDPLIVDFGSKPNSLIFRWNAGLTHNEANWHIFRGIGNEPVTSFFRTYQANTSEAEIENAIPELGEPCQCYKVAATSKLMGAFGTFGQSSYIVCVERNRGFYGTTFETEVIVITWVESDGVHYKIKSNSSRPIYQVALTDPEVTRGFGLYNILLPGEVVSGVMTNWEVCKKNQRLAVWWRDENEKLLDFLVIPYDIPLEFWDRIKICGME